MAQMLITFAMFISAIIRTARNLPKLCGSGSDRTGTLVELILARSTTKALHIEHLLF